MERKKLIIPMIVLVVLITYILYVIVDGNIDKNNSKYAYTDEEIALIMKVFSEDEIDLTKRDDFLVEVIKFNFFDKSKYKRYLEYYNQNPNLDYEDVLVHVNINIDQPFYSNIYEYENVEEKLPTILVNKYNKLPENYIPKDLIYPGEVRSISKMIKEPLEEMFKAGKKAGFDFSVRSGYRSYETQKNAYEYYKNRDGKEKADTYSARPGHSEHQLGLAVDILTVDYQKLDAEFGETEGAKWLATNAHKYGFILRYPKGKEHITGFSYEPWHFRYVGEDLAHVLYQNDWILEEYFGRQ